MATETRQETAGVDSETGSRPVRAGDPLTVPEGPLCRWYLDRTEAYADLPAAYVRDGNRFVSTSYAELLTDASAVAGGLLEFVNPGDRVAIRAETRYEWTVVDLATVLARLVLVPVYPSFSPEQTAFVLKDAGATLVVTEGELPLEAEAVVEHVLDVADLPRAAFDADAAPGLEAADEDIHTLVYTSGTTGMPKGCEITHRNVLAELAMAEEALPDLTAGAVAAAFLPLNHIYQRVSCYNALNQGLGNAYISVPSLVEELGMVRPNTIPSVPRVYRRMYDGLREAVSEESGAKRRIAEWAMSVATEYGRALETGRVGPVLEAKHGLADRLVLSTFRERLGLTDVEYAITGAASIDAEVLYFFFGMGVPLLEGYGATETTAGLTFNRLDDFRPGTVGTPMPGCEVAIAGDGEVLARGPNIMRGYWNNPEATADSIDEDGWYHTGDIGEFDGDHLRIVDRKKRLQVLDTGKNVYPAPVENRLRRSAYIEEAMVVAEGRKYVSALIQPNFGMLLSFADERGIEYDASEVRRDEFDQVIAVPESLVEDPTVEALFDREVADANAHLADYEHVKGFDLLPRALSMDHEELTPTLKKRRHNIEENWQGRIEAMYAE
jgi:long-chain acyl-CoA synthetase